MLVPERAEALTTNQPNRIKKNTNSQITCTNNCNFNYRLIITYDGSDTQKTTAIFSNGTFKQVVIFESSDDPETTKQWRHVELNNTTFTTLVTRRNMLTQLDGKGNADSIGTFHNLARRLDLSAEAGKAFSITEFHQRSPSYSGYVGESSETVIQNAGGSIKIESLQQHDGKFYQKDGEVTTATITNGAYYQGYGPGRTNETNKVNVYDKGSSGGTIGTANVNGGAFTQYAGQITTVNLSGGSFTQQVAPTPQARNAEQSTQARSLNITTLTQSGGSFTQQSGTIGTANLNGGSFTQSGGEITDLNLNGGAFNQQGGTLANLTQATGSSTISGKITTFTQNAGSSTIAKGGSITTLNLKSGSLTNNGSIETLTSGSGTTAQTRSATPQFRAATTATINHITNNGTIDKLELTKDADSVTNNAVYNTGGGLASGIIKELNVTSGNATINTLNGVGQGEGNQCRAPYAL